MSQIVNKISAKLFEPKTAKFDEKNKIIKLATILGLILECKEKDTNFGVSIMFVGDFNAIDMRTGEEYISSILYVPKSLVDMLKPKEGETSQFAVEISVKEDKTSNFGYTYIFRPLIETESPIQELKKQLIKKEVLEIPEKSQNLSSLDKKAKK